MLTTVVLLIVCALIAAAAVPLMLKLVPPNPVYGVRTEKALASAEIWYRVNVFGGRALLAAAAVAALLLITYSGTLLKSSWSQLIAFVLPITVAVVATLVYERKL
jgi:uncharacterized membrane protein